MIDETGFSKWPEDFEKKYEREKYWTNETFADRLRKLSEHFGDKIALESSKTRWTFRELEQKSKQLASGFYHLGLRPGHTAIIQLPNIPEFYAIFFGLIRMGVKPLLALPAHRAMEIKSFCRHLKADAYFFPKKDNGFNYEILAQEVQEEFPSLKFPIVVGDSEVYQELDKLYLPEQDLPESDPRELAFFLLSGGSTGLAKIIPRTQNDYLYSLRESAKICQVTHEDIYFCILPSAHNFALSSPGAIGCLYQGATVILASDPTPNSAFTIIEKTKATITALTPPLALLWLEAAPSHALRSLRLIQVGGAKFDSAGAERFFSKMHCKLQQVFGMAEGLVCYTQLGDSLELIAEAQTLPISKDDEIKIVDDQDQEVPEGESGHLLVRGPYTIRGYYRAPEINKLAFDQDGFYRTGDLVKRAENGRIVVVGRSKNVINRGGEIFSAEEVEACLRSHPAIIDAAVISEPDPRLGEISCAIIVARFSVSAAEIRQYIRLKGLAAFKIPDKILFSEELQKSAALKTDKKSLQTTPLQNDLTV